LIQPLLHKQIKRLYYTLCIVISASLFPSHSFAQDTTHVVDSLSIYNMSLEDLLKIKESGVSSQLESIINSLIGVASKKSVSLRNSPAIVTLITEEEIERSGARDLIDVLRLVPGIDFGSDVQGVVSIGIRGNWAHEGKVLLLLDGQEMNEILYSSLQLGNHFDVSQIKRIEIIRGPGSAIYGGYAEYGVINIITKSGADIHGVSASVSDGEMQNAFGHRNISVAAGNKINDFQYSLAGFFGEGNRSDATYTDFSGNSYSMAGNSNLDPENINLGLSYKGWSFRGIYDNYEMTTRDNYGTILSQAYPNNFLSEFAELKYEAKLSDKITLTPLVNFKLQKPWNFAGTVPAVDSSYTVYDKTAERYRANLTMSYDITHKINLIAGGEVYYDYASLGADTTLFQNGKRNISYTNEAVFMQVFFKNRIASLLLGGRYDNNSGYGSDFVPRLGIMKKIDKWNFKFLFNNSFRAPGIENIDFAIAPIKPEVTQVIELEAGYELASNMYLTANFFDITTWNPIVYYVDTLAVNGSYDGYKNLSGAGSTGIEVDYRLKDTWGYLDLNYSFYSTAGKTVIPADQVPTDNSMTLGFASNKFNISACYYIAKHISIAPTVSWIGKRYGYAPIDTGGSYLKLFSPMALVNLFVQYEIVSRNKLKIGIGCFNILNEDNEFIQPYNSGHAPLPGQSREFDIRLTYFLNFKK